MKPQKFPYITIVISILAIIYSFYVSYEISGSLFGRVNVIQLEPCGGVTFNHLWNLELWRLFVSQLIHVKQLHMIYNVISFFLLGVILEKYVGSARFFVLWFISGAFGTLISTLTVEPPYNLGTGASQSSVRCRCFRNLCPLEKDEHYICIKICNCFGADPRFAFRLGSSLSSKVGAYSEFSSRLVFKSLLF